MDDTICERVTRFDEALSALKSAYGQLRNSLAQAEESSRCDRRGKEIIERYKSVPRL
jgi:hypothetical protein